MSKKTGNWETEIKKLHGLIQDAIEVEHATIPPYFTAWLSMKEGYNEEPREIVKSVLIEEMLHLTLAANLLNAVGGHPNLTKPSIIPDYPHKLPYIKAAFEINIEKFSKSALKTFMQIEQPEGMRKKLDCKSFHTIGEFYHCLEKKIDKLCEDFGEERVFSGDESLQIRPGDYYGSGSVVIVKNRTTAQEAIRTIVDQGEGAHEGIFDQDHVIIGPGDGKELAHFYRFKEIDLEKHYTENDTPKKGPHGDHLNVDYKNVYPLQMNTCRKGFKEGTEQRKALDEFAVGYTDLLKALESAFNGHRSRLTEGIARMFALRRQALAIINTPLDNGKGTLGLDFTPPERL